MGSPSGILAIRKWIAAFLNCVIFATNVLLALVDLARLLLRTKAIGRRDAKWGLILEWKRTVRRCGESTFVEAAGEEESTSLRSLTYNAADALSDEVARWLATETDTRAGETVGIVMGTSCEFCVVYLGILKARCRAALVNVALRGSPLSHALSTALGDRRPMLCIADAEHLEATREALGDYVRVVCPNGVGGLRLTVRRRIEAAADDDNKRRSMLEVARRTWRRSWRRDQVQPRESEVASYLYTSGTTGLPKAAIVSESRAWAAGTCLATLSRLRRSDRVYCPLPLYHATAGLLGFWGIICGGACLIVRRKFSASRFASDLAVSHATGCLYVGVMARYLVETRSTGPNPAHQLRFAFGNGLPRDAWAAFQSRFGISRIIEFYGSTEGNVTLFNNAGAPGACGLVPRCLLWVYPIMVAKLEADDAERGDGPPRLARNATSGLCLPCAPNEPGELLGRIEKRDPSRRFDGYVGDPDHTSRKIVTNVKRPGDVYFRSGDLVAMDRFGFIYFVDRMGDTYRWKGENISTQEVEQGVLISAPDLVAEAVAFGIRPPLARSSGLGKCGMLALLLRETAPSSWPDDLYDRLFKSGLPEFAHPRFLRIVHDLPRTATHKYVKTPFVADGLDANRCSPDPIYVRDPMARAFLPFDDDARARLASGNLSL